MERAEAEAILDGDREMREVPICGTPGTQRHPPSYPADRAGRAAESPSAGFRLATLAELEAVAEAEHRAAIQAERELLPWRRARGSRSI